MRALTTLPNQITMLRILCVPLLWFLAMTNQRAYFFSLFAFVGLTDFLDGFIARHFKQISELGAKLDSIADFLVVISGFFWAKYLLPEFFANYQFIIVGVFAFYLLAQVYGLIKFKTIAAYHLYTEKVATICIYAFFIHAGFFEPSLPFFIMTTALCSVSILESILITYRSQRFEPDVVSIFSRKTL